MKLITLILIILFPLLSSASNKTPPYFASIKDDEPHNVRTGPNVRYPVRWVYKKEHWPVKVTAKFGNWSKIEDIYGEPGWIYSNSLSSKRRVITNSEGVQKIFKLPLSTSKVAAIAEKGVISDLESCKNGWCKITIKDHEGWIESQFLWGVEE